MVVLDTSFVIAYRNSRDGNHAAGLVATFDEDFRGQSGITIVPS